MAKSVKKGMGNMARKNELKYAKFMKRNDKRVARRSEADELREYIRQVA